MLSWCLGSLIFVMMYRGRQPWSHTQSAFYLPVCLVTLQSTWQISSSVRPVFQSAWLFKFSTHIQVGGLFKTSFGNVLTHILQKTLDGQIPCSNVFVFFYTLVLPTSFTWVVFEVYSLPRGQSAAGDLTLFY